MAENEYFNRVRFLFWQIFRKLVKFRSISSWVLAVKLVEKFTSLYHLKRYVNFWQFANVYYKCICKKMSNLVFSLINISTNKLCSEVTCKCLCNGLKYSLLR